MPRHKSRGTDAIPGGFLERVCSAVATCLTTDILCPRIYFKLFYDKGTEIVGLKKRISEHNVK